MIDHTHIEAMWETFREAGLRPPPVKDVARSMATWAAVLADLTPDDIERATLAHLRHPSPWWPMPGQVLALARPQATKEQTSASADIDLETVRRRWGIIAGDYSAARGGGRAVDEALALRLMLPGEGEPDRGRAGPLVRVDGADGRPAYRRDYPPTSAEDAARYARIRAVLVRTGGLTPLWRAMTGSPEEMAAYSWTWRHTVTGEAQEGARQLIAGPAGMQPLLAEGEEAVGRHDRASLERWMGVGR